MTLQERFAELFKGNFDVYGRTILIDGPPDENGKTQSRSWLIKEPLTREVLESHLSGETPIGMVPIDSENRVGWGAIDVDIYTHGETLSRLRDRVERDNLPFVVCRSKSGGAHLFLFLKKKVLAKNLIPVLEKYAAMFGHGTCEIYPKQALIRTETEVGYGNWINLPYDGPGTLRYAIGENESPLSLEAFLDLAESRKITLDEAKGTPAPHELIFPDGPPCLNYLLDARNISDNMRNVTLSNTAVYLKAKDIETWKDELNRINQLFPTPLPDKELEAIKKSYEKKDYRYQCRQAPLCDHCDARTCKTRTYGIARNEVVASQRSLTKIGTEPPIWVILINDKQLELTTDELFNFRLFSKKCLEVLNYIPAPMKDADWIDLVNQMTQKCITIEIPEEMTPRGQFKEMFESWLTNSYTEDTMENVLRGVVYRDVRGYHFRMRDLTQYLEREKFRELKQNDLQKIITQDYKGQRTFTRIKRTGVNLWTVPNTFDEPMPLEPLTQPEQPF